MKIELKKDEVGEGFFRFQSIGQASFIPTQALPLYVQWLEKRLEGKQSVHSGVASPQTGIKFVGMFVNGCSPPHMSQF